MSRDIKYIVVGVDGEHTRFPCLAIVRYTMAAAVTMLAIAVVALVIHAMLRSEDIRLSVNNVFIGADNLWFDISDQSSTKHSSEQVTMVGQQVEAAKLSRHASKIQAATIGGQSSVEDGNNDAYGAAVNQQAGTTVQANIGSSGGQARHRATVTQTQVTLHKVNNTNLHVILIANNPSGRTKIDCNNTTVSLVDMQPPKGVIGTLKLDNFTVPPQTTITLQQRLNDTNTSYIWSNYGWDVTFSVMVQVKASVTSYPLGKMSKPKVQSYECQPVTVGLMDDEASFATGQVDCSSRATVSTIAPEPAQAPAPALAPAPAPARY